ncbi:dihydrolipoyl dehydrogenase [Pacificispira spongiicola]|nr:dihydrolipoyl dehydrogenase [Pacificispira spongiicola]
MGEQKTDVVILGAGTAGFQAMAQLRRAGRDVLMFDGGTLGTTCARVGCMPSKVAIQIGEDLHRGRHAFGEDGISGGDGLTLDRAAALRRVRALRDGFVKKTNARTVDAMEPGRLIRHHGRFVEPTVLEAGGERYRFDTAVIATGSRPVLPPSWVERLGDRLLHTDMLFEQETLPDRIAVVGLGAIGLELGQALSRWGITVTGFDLQETIAGLVDPVARDAALAALRQSFPIHLGLAADPQVTADGIAMDTPNGPVIVDAVIAAMGRRPNLDGLGLDALGIETDKRGMPEYDPATMRIGKTPIFFAGDVNGDRAVLHEAADEGRIAGWNVARADAPTRFRRKVPLGVVFSDPNIATVGPVADIVASPDTVVGTAAMTANGRATVLGQTGGVLRVYGRKTDGRLLGASLIGVHAEHLGHLMAWAVQAGTTVYDTLSMPFYHPVVEEALQNALRDLAGQVGKPVDVPWDLIPEDATPLAAD